MIQEDLSHEVIRASAGTGKTYALTSRYLALLANDMQPTNILATTFTRKAAGEILDRVLKRLAVAVLAPEDARKLATDIKNEDLRSHHCQKMLKQLCDSLHRLSISTLDSFFSRVAQSFRHELGLPTNMRVVDEGDPLAVQLRQQAIDDLLADEDPIVLLDLLQRLHYDAPGRSVTQSIDDIITGLEETYYEAPNATLWQQYEYASPLEDKQVNALLEQLEGLLSADLPKSPLKSLAKHHAEILNEDWKSFLSAGLAAKVAAGEETYSRWVISPEVLDVISPLLEHARSSMIQQHARATQATFDLLSRFTAHYSELREQQHVLLFSDMPRRLARYLSNADEQILMDLYYRLDQRVGHLLLDEFQDTSIQQWSILEPIAMEIRSWAGGERSLFVVGDVKQAIYGWRGGCADIFEHIEGALDLPSEAIKSLNKSYRSAQPILDTVNQVFGSLDGNPALKKLDPLPTEWQQRFEAHTSAHMDMPGYVELRTSPASVQGDEVDDPDDLTAGHMGYAAQRIKAIVEQAPQASVGVLMRKNASVQQMIDLLRSPEIGVHASGEGGVPLTDEPAVLAMLSAMQLADHPGNSAAAFHVVNSPLGEVLGLTAIKGAQVVEVSRQLRTQIATRGYVDLIMHWASLLAPQCDERAVQRLSQLVELADRYEPFATLRPTDFVRYVSYAVVEEPSPAPVRVMTVHKSKGLEFDVVVLCELDGLIARVGNNAVDVLRDSPTAPIEAVYRSSNETLRSLYPPLEEAWQQQRARRFDDDLCNLYVAMTRAANSLHLIIKPLQLTSTGKVSSKGLTSATPAAVLRQSLSTLGGEESTAGEQVLYQHGNLNWPPENLPGDSDTVEEASKPYRVTPAVAGTGRTSRRVAPSGLEGGGVIRAADLLSLEADGARLRGSVIHAWFEQIDWLENGAAMPDEETLRAIALQVAPSLDTPSLEQWLKQYRQMLTQPVVREALNRPAVSANQSVSLWREHRFAVPHGKQLLQGIFDRVTVIYETDVPVQATILDFKTDSASPENIDELTEHYRPQIKAYQHALCHMLQLSADKVNAQLLFVSANMCVDL